MHYQAAGENLEEMPDSKPEPEPEYASAGERLMAWLIDTLIVTIIGFAAAGMGVLLVILFGLDFANFDFESDWGYIALIGLLVAGIVFAWLLFVWHMVATQGQTPGKKVVKIRIVKTDGSGLGCLVMAMREIVGKMVVTGMLTSVLGLIFQLVSVELSSGGMLIFFALFIWLVIDRKNQTLHDKIADTVVIKVK